MGNSNGRAWPYIISGSIILVFGFCVATIVVTSTMPVQKSDAYMMNYHEADAKANDLIEARIAFDKQYKIDYITKKLSSDNTDIEYKVSDVNGNAINDAKIIVVVTRPNTHDFDQELQSPSVENGVYSFKSVTLPKEGRWDIMAKVQINGMSRYYNVKADTRYTEAYEY